MHWILGLIGAVVLSVILSVLAFNWLVDQLLGPVGIVLTIVIVAFVALARFLSGASESAKGKAIMGGAIGGAVLGFSGCVSCLNNPPPTGSFPFPIFGFNLFSGAVIGALVGAAIGAMTDQT